jgi:perosamine synthetase
LVLGESHGFDAEEAMRRLAELKVGTRPFFWPMHEQPVFRKMGLFEGVACPVAERLARRGFYIPSGLGLSADDHQAVAQRMQVSFKFYG